MPCDSTQSRPPASSHSWGQEAEGQAPRAGALFDGDRALERAAGTAGPQERSVPASCGLDGSEDRFSIARAKRYLDSELGSGADEGLGFGNRTAAAAGDSRARQGALLTWRARPVPRAPCGRGLRWRGESSRPIGLLGFQLYT